MVLQRFRGQGWRWDECRLGLDWRLCSRSEGAWEYNRGDNDGEP